MRNKDKKIILTFKKIPIDITICLALSTILLPIALLQIQNPIRIILGLPYILFIPGYTLIYTLFPTTEQIDTIERIALSLGLSLSIVPLIGLGLNYTPYGITLTSTITATYIFITITSITSYIRWKQTPERKRIHQKIEIKIPQYQNKIDKILTIILTISIIIASITLIYVITTPKTGEKFTEFYLLGSQGKLADYPINLLVGEQEKVTIGIANHEQKTINYTVEIWLINQTTKNNQTNINHMWYMGKYTARLNHTSVDIEKKWTPQWEQNHTISIYRQGQHKLTFLLFTHPTEEYTQRADYKELYTQKTKDAYQQLHLQVTVQPWT